MSAPASVPSLLDSVRDTLKRRAWHSGVTFDAGRCVAIEEALERARVVGVLDAWAGSPFDGTSVQARRVSVMPAHMGSGWRCYLQIGIGAMNCRAHKFSGETADAARAAAAKAIESGEV